MTIVSSKYAQALSDEDVVTSCIQFNAKMTWQPEILFKYIGKYLKISNHFHQKMITKYQSNISSRIAPGLNHTSYSTVVFFT